MTASRELLFGLLALQTNFIDRNALVRAFDAWSADKSKTIAQWLVSQGSIAEEELKLLEGLVDKFLDRNGGDPDKSLSALGSASGIDWHAARASQGDLRASLAPRVSPPVSQQPQPEAADPFKTVGVAVDPNSDGTRFRIVRPHAEGGLGRVFVARDLELNREVALKRIKEEHADDIDSRSRFQLEAEVTGCLEHPGIVPVYGLGTYENGRPFYAMRFIRGESLRDEIERFHGSQSGGSSEADAPQTIAGQPPHATSNLRLDVGERAVTFRKLLQRFIAVCEAVNYAHSRGVLHRDLKPANIMIGRYGETLVVDWGLAKVMGSTIKEETPEPKIIPSSGSGSAPTMMGTAVGTPAYMSPEQAAGRLDSLGPTSDVYSLGATLYAILTGSSPFDSTGPINIGELLGMVQRGDYSLPRDLNRYVPKPLESICVKAMAVRPEDRYASASELASDIERYLADEPVRAQQESFTERMTRFGRRHRSLVGFGSLATAIVAIIAIIAVFQIDDAHDSVVAAKDELIDLNKKLQVSVDREIAGRDAAEEDRDEALLERDLVVGMFARVVAGTLTSGATIDKVHKDFEDLTSPVAMIDALHGFAGLLQRQGDDTEAELLYREALEVTTNLKDEARRKTLIEALGKLLRDQGRAAEADKLSDPAPSGASAGIDRPAVR